MPEASVRIHGVDFTSTPSRSKRIVIAGGGLAADTLVIDKLESIEAQGIGVRIGVRVVVRHDSRSQIVTFVTVLA